MMEKYNNNALIGLAAFVIVIAGMKIAASIIVPFLLASFLAIICSPVLFWMKEKGINGTVAIVLLLSIVLFTFLTFGSLIASSLSDFSNNVPLYQDNLKSMLARGWAWISSKGINLDKTLLDEMINPGKAMQFAANTLNSLGGFLTNAFMIILLFLFILMEASIIPSKIMAIHNDSGQSLANYSKITQGVNRYIVLKTATSIFTGGIVTVWLFAQGVDYPFMWGLVAFLLNFIPNIGSIIAAIPAILLSLVQFGVGSALITALGYLFVNIIIGSILEPKIMGKDMGLSSLVVFISMIFWGWVLGPVGMLLSVPLTMGIKIILNENEQSRWVSILLGSGLETKH